MRMRISSRCSGKMYYYGCNCNRLQHLLYPIHTRATPNGGIVARGGSYIPKRLLANFLGIHLNQCPQLEQYSPLCGPLPRISNRPSFTTELAFGYQMGRDLVNDQHTSSGVSLSLLTRTTHVPVRLVLYAMVRFFPFIDRSA